MSDELLMSFADGVLPADEHARVAERIAADPALKARLTPFVVTRTELPALFADATYGPIPDRLLKAVREAPQRRTNHAAPSRTGNGLISSAAAGLAAIKDALMPANFGLAHAFSFAALFATGAASGWLWAAMPHGKSVAATDIAFDGGRLLATGKLAGVLEGAASLKSTAAVHNGEIAALLTFTANDKRFCRQYEMASVSGAHYAGIACREAAGTWHVVMHTPFQGGKPAASGADFETAAGPGAPEIEAAIDKMSDGSRLDHSAETALIARGWKAE